MMSIDDGDGDDVDGDVDDDDEENPIKRTVVRIINKKKKKTKRLRPQLLLHLINIHWFYHPFNFFFFSVGN